jgi:hypothetical protein
MARFSDRWRYPSHKTILQESFGVDSVVATIEFPTRLATLASRLPSGHPWGVDKIVREHTLLPWYEPFLPTERIARLREAMLENGGQSVSGVAGLQQSRIAVPKHLRFCPDCFRQDWEAGHELYWRRLHQMSGIEVCPQHKVWLENSEVIRQGRVTRHTYIVPPLELRDMASRPVKASDMILQNMACLGEQLMHGMWPNLGLQALRQNLMRLLTGAGYVSPNGHVRMQQLLPAMASSFPPCFLEKLGGKDWVERLLRNPKGMPSPIRYLALLAFLDAGLDQLFARDRGDEMIVKEVPSCPNHLCVGVGQPMAFAETERSRDFTAPVDVFVCKCCGYEVARCSSSKEKEWVRGRGPIWQSRLRQLWDDPNVSLRGMAVELRADAHTVKRQALKAGLHFPRKGRRKTTMRGLRQKNAKPVAGLRKRWMTARERHPDFGVKALRSKHPALYASLYRLDREWLTANRPPRVMFIPKRLDWQTRDEQVSARITVVEQRLKSGKRRVSATSILREAGVLKWQSKLGKLPKCRAIVARLAENRAGYACRRVERVTTVNLNSGLCLPEWALNRRAGLRPEVIKLPSVRQAVDGAMHDLMRAAERN